jgi:hypothetical protein
MLNPHLFNELMTTLENFYGSTKVLGDRFLEATYYQSLEKLSDGEFTKAVAVCIRENSKQYGFFPSPKQLVEYSGIDQRPPGEKGIGNYNAPALPSVEINRDNLTDEQAEARKVALRLETLRKVSEAQQNARKRRNGFYHVGRVLSPVEAKNEEMARMRTYLKTGIKELTNRAIAWVNNRANNCVFVYNEKGQIIDIREWNPEEVEEIADTHELEF